MKSPLLLLAAALALGIAFGHRFGLGLGIADFLGSAGAGMLGGLLALRRGWRGLAQALALAGFVAAGAGADRLFAFRFPPNHVSRIAAIGVDLDDPLRLEGRLVSSPLRTSYGFQFDVEVNQVESRGRAHEVTGKVRLRLQTPADSETLAAADALRLEYGDSMRALVRLRKPRIYHNPGSFDFRRWTESVEDITWVGTIRNPLLLEKLAASGAPMLDGFFLRQRRRLLDAIDALYTPWSAEGKYGAVVKATLLGDRTSLDSNTIENFRKTGLYHQLVVSGLQVALLALLASVFVRLLPFRESWRSALVLVLLLVYALLIEQRAPTLRATLMIFAYLLARWLYREHAALNAIGLAALILLVHRPAWLFESGFQLSFAAVLLIAGLAVPVLARTTEPYRRALTQLDNVDLDIILPPRVAQFRVDLRALINAAQKRSAFVARYPAAASAAARVPIGLVLWTVNAVLFSAIIQLGLLLPMAESFHRVTFAGIGLNALAMPLMTALLGVAVPVVLLAVTIPALAVWSAEVLGALTAALLWLTEFPGMPAWLSYRVPEPPAWVSWGFALSIVLAAWTLGRYRRIFLASLASTAAFLILISLHPFAPRLPRGVVEMTALDCGGDAVFIVLPDQTTMLIDAGGSSRRWGREGAFRGRRWDAGEDVVSPYLWSRGVKKIDVVVLTNPHEDHVGGLPAVVNNFQVGEFWHAVNRPTDSAQKLFAQLWEQGVPVRKVAAGTVISLGGATVHILWPPTGDRASESLPQDASIVMRISAGESSLLLPGDVSERVEQELLASGIPIQSRVLKVADHGSKSSSSRPFLDRVSPRVAIVSAESAVNLPSPQTLERLRSVGAQVFRTDRDGAVTVEMKGASLLVRTHRKSPAD